MKAVAAWLDRYFHLAAAGTTVRTEAVAGLTTFLTMAYIIVVQPAVLTGLMFNFNTGMDFGAVMAATCISSAIATIMMGLYANYPIALAPGMGENFFFVFSIIPAAAAIPAVQSGATTPWAVALGVIFISGLLFMAISMVGLREIILNGVSPSLKHGIAVGIGLFIAFIGLQNATLIVKDAGTAVKLNPHILSPDLLVFGFGLLLTGILQARRVRGAILWGILCTAAAALALRLLIPHLPIRIQNAELIKQSMLLTRFVPADQIWSLPPSLEPTLFKMDIRHALNMALVPFIVIVLFMDVFDTLGTLIGVSEQAGLMRDGKLPRARQVLLTDAAGTVVGACAGTSTVTSFIESAAGVEYGGRTGLSAVVAGLLFLLALFFHPLVYMFGSYAPITAPALVMVGAMMIRNIRFLAWDDFSEVLPAFLIMLGIPLTYSISNGLALGFISYPVIKLCSGKGRQVGWLAYVLAAVLVLYFIFTGLEGK